MPANPAIPMNSVQVWIPRIGLMLIGLLLMGNRPACDNRQPNLTCDTDTLVTALPGSCVQIDNPCDPTGAWSRVDGLRLCDEPAGLFIQTRRRRSGVTRELCAGPSVGGLVDEPVSFVFVRPGNLGEGQFLVTTGAALSVSAFATPGTIDPGQSSQLDAVVSGGTAPYTYDWSPATGLSATNIQDPMASPNFTVSYTVEVTDDDGIPTSANVTVNVNTGLTVTANPPLIDPGSSSQLSADFSGALPPVTYNWIPVDSLNDSTLQSLLASPIINTTYLVLPSTSLERRCPVKSR